MFEEALNERREPAVDTVFKISEMVNGFSGTYRNEIASRVNDHVVRVSVMLEPYFWHYHPDSDETFIVMEGQLGIELQDREVVLNAGEIMTISSGIVHRTRPIGGRSVNLTVESAGLTTIRVEPGH
jgi:mannose-6-phosphate isomerase-like protein (cupin superfamily)